MLETHVIGSREWAMGVLTHRDMTYLEDFDREMRIRSLDQRTESQKAKTYEQLVEQDGSKMLTHCEHGILLYRKCALCRALRG